MDDVGGAEVLERAAGERDEDRVLSDPDGEGEGGCAGVVPAGEAPAQARGRRLDAVLESVLHVDLVKLDVEGADLHALRGMKGLLDRCKPVLFVECHDIYGYYTRAELEGALTGLCYGFEIAH